MKKKIFSQKEGLSREHRSFKKMHARVKEGRVKYCHWTYDATGFEEFIACKKNNPAKAAWDRGAYKNRKKRGLFKRRSPTAETLKLMSIGMKISSMKRNSKLEFNGILGFGC